MCGTFTITASQQPIREHCWSSVQVDCSLAAGYRLTVVDECGERVDVSDGEPTGLSAPSPALHTELTCSSLFVGGSPSHKPPEYFTGHIAALSLSPLSQIPPHPQRPHNTRLPPLPTRSLPLHSFAALLSTPPFSPLTVTPHAFPKRRPSSHPPVIVCHDMRGGYTDDFHCQSIAHSPHTTAYAFQHYAHIDTLIYFSHTRITVPPSAHIVAAHKEGVRVLGTVITEWREGETETVNLVTRDGGEEYAKALVRLCEYHGFDGWLINIEAPLLPTLIPVLIQFLATLRRLLHASPHIRSPQLVWYDSLSAQTGQIAYQSQLHPDHNLPFFRVVDALFTDYHWQPPQPAVSARIAGERTRDVYTGVDVWGRGTYKGGGWATREAMDEVDKTGGGVALFGTGWTLEALGLMGDRRRWEWVDRRFWLGDDVIEIDVHGNEEWDTVQQAMAGWQRLRRDVDDDKEEEKQETKEQEAEQQRDKEWDSDEDWLKGWALVDDDQKGRVLVTSHRWCRRWREIDLYAYGLTPDMLASSPLVITQSYRGSQPNPADHYYLRLKFYSASRVEFTPNSIVKQEVCGAEWRVTRIESGCNLIRYIRWEEGGKDTEGWAGHYGCRLGRGKIEIRVGGAKLDKAVGRQARRRKLPLQFPLLCTFNVGSGGNRWRGGRRLRHESQPLQPGEEKQADVGQYGVMEDEKHTMQVRGEWSDLHEQDVQTYLRDVLRAGETKQFMTAELSEEVVFEGGRSLCFTVRPAITVTEDVDSRNFDVLEFDKPPAGSTEPPVPLILHLYLKEADGIDLRPYIRLHSSELIELEPISQKTWANVPGAGGWCQKVWIFTLSPSDIAAIVVQARTWWPRTELGGVKSYVGQIAFTYAYSEHALCAHLDENGFSLASLVAWHLPSPSLDSGLYTVYLAWLPPVFTTDGGRLAFVKHFSYEVEVDGMYVGRTKRCLYAMEGVSEKRMRQGKWGVRCIIHSGCRQTGQVQTVNALMLSTSSTEAEGEEEEQQVNKEKGDETVERKQQLDDGSDEGRRAGDERRARRKPLPPLVLDLVDEHCKQAGLVGEHGDAIKRQLLAHMRL